MGLVKRAADLAYTFRFIRMMVMDWKDWDAYKLGIIDENVKRNKNVKMDSDEKRSAYTPFIRLAANIKRLISKIPGGGSKLGSFASALYLIKEKVGTKGLEKICKELDVDVLDFLNEKNEWFLLEDKHWPVMKPFLIFLNYIRNDQYTGITMDPEVVNVLRKI